jgi:hypothetical protein
MSNPNQGDAPKPPEAHWSQARLELRDWLRRTSPSLAELYEGAVHLIYYSRPPGWTRLVCHAIREIGNGVPEAFTGEKAGMLPHTTRVQRIRELWEGFGLPMDASVPGQLLKGSVEALTEVRIPADIYQQFAELIMDHAASWQSRRKLATKFFATIAGQDAEAQKALRPHVEQWVTIIQWFVNHAHDDGDVDASFDVREIETKFELFETTVLAVIRGFFSTTDALNEILAEANS